MRSWTKVVVVETEQSKKVEYTELGGVRRVEGEGGRKEESQDPTSGLSSGTVVIDCWAYRIKNGCGEDCLVTDPSPARSVLSLFHLTNSNTINPASQPASHTPRVPCGLLWATDL